MSRLVSELVEQISSIPHHSNEQALKDLLTRWRSSVDLSLIRQELHRWLAGTVNADLIKNAARETSTHYVWPLHLCSNGYGLAINEFKGADHTGSGYATVIHNHRYSFASLMLSGRYTQIQSEVEIPIPGQAGRIDDIAQLDMTEGCISTINHNEFHRLTEVSNNTVTLLLKCPAAKKDSISVDIQTLKVSRHVPVEARLAELLNVLVDGSDVKTIEENPYAGLG